MGVKSLETNRMAFYSLPILTYLPVSLRTFIFVAITGKMMVFPIIQIKYG